MNGRGSRRALALGLAASLLTPLAVAAQTPQLVDIGGYRLDVLQAGHANPPVILIAGLGDPLDDWHLVWPAVAESATVVAYSRAGIGRSDPGPGDYSARAEVAELHALMVALQLAPPYVLVAKSYGGILARLYVSSYPAEVAGLVLVDATHEQQVARWGTLDSTYPAAFRRFFDSVLAVRPKGAETGEIRETMRIQARGAVEGMKPLPDIPLAVITSMKSSPHPRYVNQTVQGHELWREMHEEWFLRSRNAVHLVTNRSGHDIEEEDPSLVLQGIQFVLREVRQ